MNPHYAKRAQALVDFALSLSDSAKDLEHAGLRGRAREVFAKDLFAPFLSPDIGICTGLAVDSEGNASRQIDIIVYDRTLIPTLLFTGEEGVVPIESVLATVEVKSELSRHELLNAVENARSVKKLQPKYIEIENGSPDKLSPLCCVFAFDSDCTSTREVCRLKQVVAEANEKCEQKVYVPLSGICIGDKSFIQCTKIEHGVVPEPTFNTYESKSAIRFLVFLVDQISIQKSQRSKMLMFHYFLENDNRA